MNDDEWIQGSQEAVEEDLRLMDLGEDFWGKVLKEKDGLRAWTHAGYGGRKAVLIRVQGDVEVPQGVSALRDLLDVHLLERQHEWHHLFLQGHIVGRTPPHELCSMTYASGPFAADRECLYRKTTHELEPSGSFILSYRSVSPANSPLPPKGAVRLFMHVAAHRVEVLDENRVRVTYIQQAIPGGWVPIVLSNRAQVGIILKEFATLREVMAGRPLKGLPAP